MNSLADDDKVVESLFQRMAAAPMPPDYAPLETLSAPGYQRPLIAGWLSLIAHLLAIIVGVLLWHVPPRLSLVDEERPVQIVLASSTAGSETKYFEQTEAA